jgi:hypothetical protein
VNVGWFEVKPLMTSELKAGNFLPLLQALQGSSRPIRFLIVDAADPEFKDRRSVRFFLQAPDELEGYASGVVKAMLNVEVTRADPPKLAYRRCLDLELANKPSYPVCPIEEKQNVNIIDRVVSALAGTGGAVEVTAFGDPRAAVNIESEIYKLEHGKADLSKTLMDFGVGIIAEGTVQRDVQDIRREKWWEYGQQYKKSAWAKQAIDMARQKVIRPLFTCSVTVYGDMPEAVEKVKNALPSFVNRFKTFRRLRGKGGKPLKPEERPKKPSKHTLRNFGVSALRLGIPFGVLALSLLTGALNVNRILAEGISPTSPDGIVILATALSAISAAILLRKRHPIILSDIELSQLIGLPTAVGKLPVAVGRLPSSRMQLGGDLSQQPSVVKEGAAEVGELPGDYDEGG